MKIPIILIGGATASGKSALAFDLACRFDGEIINGDSLQLYKGLPILTAKPSKEFLKSIPHRLYNVLTLKEFGSVAKWQSLALQEIQTVFKAQKLPIIVGGTGFYLSSLVKGLSKIPLINETVRNQAQQDYGTMGASDFFERLKKHDPLMAFTLHPEDKQRCIRAWEVLIGTGKSLREWQTEIDRTSIEHLTVLEICLLPERKKHLSYADHRFDQMVKAGVVEEVREFNNTYSFPNHPFAKAVGYQELSSYLREELTLEEAISLSKIATHQYIKRQSTWFRNQVKKAYIMKDIYFSEGSSLPQNLLEKCTHFLAER